MRCRAVRFSPGRAFVRSFVRSFSVAGLCNSELRRSSVRTAPHRAVAVIRLSSDCDCDCDYLQNTYVTSQTSHSRPGQARPSHAAPDNRLARHHIHHHPSPHTLAHHTSASTTRIRAIPLPARAPRRRARAPCWDGRTACGVCGRARAVGGLREGGREGGAASLAGC